MDCPYFLRYRSGMKLYRHWAFATKSIKDAEGNPLLLKKWGGSNNSPAAAEDTARSKVEDLAARLMRKADVQWASDYTYSTRDLPEELIEEIDGNSGITRNRYGCLVLNTDNMMIADIDLPKPGWFAKLMKVLGKHKALTEAEALLKLTDWLGHHPDAGVRVYRTAAGLRYLFCHIPLTPDAKTFEWLEELGSDRLYVFLCKEQQSFRARLTPKPWRCGQERPPANMYPFVNEKSANSFGNWLRAYEAKAQPFATCTYLSTYGRSAIHPDLQRQISRHDALTRSASGIQLA